MAALIPVLLVGDLTDPKGKGAALNEHFQNKAAFPPDVFEEYLVTKIIGDRMIIRSIFVAHPNNPDQDSSVLELAEELVRSVAAQQGRPGGYDGVCVGLLRGPPAEFKRTHAGKQAVTHADLRVLL